MTNTTERGLSDCDKLILSFMKSYISRLKPKTIFYHNYKNFDEEKFVKIFIFQIMIQTRTIQSTLTRSKLVYRHVPLTMKIQRGNHAPVISKEMEKAVYTHSTLRNKFYKNPSEENERKYKRPRNLYVSLRCNAIKQYFSNITSKGIVTNIKF